MYPIYCTSEYLNKGEQFPSIEQDVQEVFGKVFVGVFQI